MKNLRNQQGEMMDNQIVKKPNKHIKKRKKKKKEKNSQFSNSRISVLVVHVLLF
jgi:uncharacterized membrane protein